MCRRLAGHASEAPAWEEFLPGKHPRIVGQISGFKKTCVCLLDYFIGFFVVFVEISAVNAGYCHTLGEEFQLARWWDPTLWPALWSQMH